MAAWQLACACGGNEPSACGKNTQAHCRYSIDSQEAHALACLLTVTATSASWCWCRDLEVMCGSEVQQAQLPCRILRHKPGGLYGAHMS